MSSGSLSAAGAAAVASFSSTADDGHPLHHELAMAVADVTAISIQNRKEQTLLALKSELMATLDKEVKSLDDDSWMFVGPRSRINLISRPGKFTPRQNMAFAETRIHVVVFDTGIKNCQLITIWPHKNDGRCPQGF